MAQKNPRPLYSSAWLARYGRQLHDDDIRLVQAYRGLSEPQQSALLTRLSFMIIENAQTGVKAAKKGAR